MPTKYADINSALIKVVNFFREKIRFTKFYYLFVKERVSKKINGCFRKTKLGQLRKIWKLEQKTSFQT